MKLIKQPLKTDTACNNTLLPERVASAGSVVGLIKNAAERLLIVFSNLNNKYYERK